MCACRPRQLRFAARAWIAGSLVLALQALPGCGFGLPFSMPWFGGGSAQADSASPPAPPVIYKWIDEEGIAHYTADPKRVPENVRARIDAAAPSEGVDSGPSSAAPFDRSDHWAALDAEPHGDGAPGVASAPADPGAEFGVEEPRASPALRSQISALDEQIASLEAEIARDEQAIQDLLAEEGDGAELRARPEFRDVAARLPQLQAQRRGLYERRARLESR